MLQISEIISVVQIARSDKLTRTIALAVLVISMLAAIFLSSLTAFLLVISYLSGIIVLLILLKGNSLGPTNQTHNLCTICNGPQCTRHQNNSRFPWRNINICNELNASVETFFDHILNEFVTSWYKNYTNDKAFTYELKHSIRFACATAIKRFLELDIGLIVTNKLIPNVVKHIDDYMCMDQISELKSTDINSIAISYLGKRLHVAATSRNNELKYLQNLATALTERLLPAENLKCRNIAILLREILSGWVLLPLMDVLADPHIINQLVILSLTYKSKSSLKQKSINKTVEFLCNYGEADHKSVALAIDIKTIIHDPVHLYQFMQFLKKEGAVHYLQFYLDIEDFNSNLLQPDLSKHQLEELHADATTLYKDYLQPDSDNFIGCSMDIVTELCELLDEGVYNVAKLQTAEPLYKASEYAFNVLEKEWLPLFYHSTEFYILVAGNKSLNNFTKSSATSPFISGSPIRLRQKRMQENQGTVAKLSNSFGKIKGALQTRQPVEGAIYPYELRSTPQEMAIVEDFVECSTSRNLSTWRIAIPAVETHQYGTKTVFEYNIDVQRTDALAEGEPRNWIVKRRDQDFYTLKSKLAEFHGESEICSSPLPTRRTAVSLDERKAMYEEFIKKLLGKPLLKGSDLLYTFLKTPQDFTLFVTAAIPVVDLENIYQSVASKWRREKGQCLDTFLVSFFNSTGHSNAPKFEWAEISDEIESSNPKLIHSLPKTFKNRVFGDNYSSVYKREVQGSSSSIQPNGITDSIFYLLKHILRVPETILRFFVSICSVAQQTVEMLSRFYIERKIKSALNQLTLAFLIRELDELIMGKIEPTTDEERAEVKERARTLCENAIPNICVTLFGEKFKSGLLKLLVILQNPLYNKQLAYSLIDVVIAEMYPELDTSDEFY